MQLWIHLFFNFQQCWSGLLLQLCDPLRGALRAPPPRSGEVALLTNSCFSHCSPLCNKTRSCAEVSSSTFYFRTRSCSSSPSSTSAAPPAGRSVCMSFWFTPVSFRVVDRNFYTVLKKKTKKKNHIMRCCFKDQIFDLCLSVYSSCWYFIQHVCILQLLLY